MKLNPFRRSSGGTTGDTEGARAYEALRKVRGRDFHASGGGEWRDVRRRRRARQAVRIAAGVGLLAVTGGIAIGVLFGSREGFAWVRANTSLFHVQDVLVTGMDKLSREDVIGAAGLSIGQDILGVNPDSVEARVARLPRIKSVEARRTWKREVTLSIVERKAEALVLLDRLCEVDDEGVVLPGDASGSVSDLTIVRGIDGQPSTAGTRLQSPGLLPALSLIGTLSRPELGLAAAVSEIWAGDADSLVMFMLQDGVPVRVGRGDIPPRRLMAFRGVMEDLAARKIDPEYLDLRFAGQVVVKPRPEVEDEKGKASSAPPAGNRPARRGPVQRGRRSRHGLNT